MFSHSLSQTFKVAGLIAALFVVALHYVPTDEMHPGYQYSLNLVLQDLLSNGIFRVAVPAFAMTSGFFYFLSYTTVRDWAPKLQQRLRSVAAPYLIVSTLFFVVFITSQWALSEDTVSITASSLATNILLHPLSVQLWYLRDLMILVLLAPLFNPSSRWHGALLITLAACWLFDMNFLPRIAGWHLLNLDTLFFFTVGAWLSRRPAQLERLTDLSHTYLTSLQLLWCILSAWRISLYPGLTVWYEQSYTLTSLLLFKTTLIIGLLLLFNAAARLRNKPALLQLSTYSFFIYLFHFFPINEVLYRISGHLMAEAYRFWLCAPLAVILTLVAARLCEQWLPGGYRILNGGRSAV
jgi:surface polysaccharide O-acyltransferase-like enzyme